MWHLVQYLEKIINYYTYGVIVTPFCESPYQNKPFLIWIVFKPPPKNILWNK